MSAGGRHGVVCAGCWTADRIKRIDAWPEQDTLARIERIDRHGGGSAHNVGHDLKRLQPELPVEAIGLLGNDSDGDFLFTGARKAGMDVTQLHRSDTVQTSFTDVMSVAGSGRRTFFHHAGANDALTPDHIDLAATRGRMLHLGLVGLHAVLDAPWQQEANGWAAVLSRAQRLGLHTNLELVSIEPARLRRLALPCLAHLDTLIVNDHEIGALSERRTVQDGVTDVVACERAARDVLSMGAMRLVVVHWPRGALAITREGALHRCDSEAVPPERILGAVGAGDAFAAGVLLTLHDGGGIDAAMQLGHRAAADSLLCADAVSGVRATGMSPF